MNALDYALEVKSIGDDGEIAGLAVSVGTLDEGNDIVAPGAITRSIMGRKAIPMLLYHDHKQPVGVWTDFRETASGLEVKGCFDPTDEGSKARVRARSGSLAGLSMGYRTLKQRFEGKARHLLEVALDEISLVAVPMNRRTLVTSVKDITGSGALPTLPQFEEFLREAGGFSRTEATAIAGKGLASLLRGEPGGNTAADFLSALRAGLSA